MRYALPTLLLALLVPATAAEEYPARVIGVSDGDTITVLRDGRQQVKIRLHGVDAPESAQAFGSRSKQSASELAFGKDVTIQVRDVDRYGRTVAVVILPDGRSLNEEQVRGGMAWWYRSYAPKDRQLSTAEEEARAAKRGLWSDPRPVPPWEWRKRPADAAPVPAGVVIGNARSKVFHAPSCASVRKMKPTNRVEFRSADEAAKAGYRKAGDCR